MVQDIAPGSDGSGPRAFTPVGNRVFFIADDAVNGLEPWIGRAALLVDQPRRAIQDLSDEVNALPLPKGIVNSLTVKLDRAARALARPDGTLKAILALEAFVNEVEAQSPTKISEGAAASLREFAQDIVALLEGAFSVAVGGS